MTWRTYLLLALIGLAVVDCGRRSSTIPRLHGCRLLFMPGDCNWRLVMALLNHIFGIILITRWGCPILRMHIGCLWRLLVAAAGLVFSVCNLGCCPGWFYFVAALIPPITAALAWSFSSRRDLALTSGLLAVFPAFYLPFLPVTDTFGLYMLFGGLFFLVLNRKPSNPEPFLLGLLAGLMHLTRADGLLWLLFAIIASDLCVTQTPHQRNRHAIIVFLSDHCRLFVDHDSLVYSKHSRHLARRLAPGKFKDALAHFL